MKDIKKKKILVLSLKEVMVLMIGGIGDDYGGGCGGVDDDDYGGDFCGGSGQDVHLVPLSSSSTFWRSC